MKSIGSLAALANNILFISSLPFLVVDHNTLAGFAHCLKNLQRVGSFTTFRNAATLLAGRPGRVFLHFLRSGVLVDFLLNPSGGVALFSSTTCLFFFRGSSGLGCGEGDGVQAKTFSRSSSLLMMPLLCRSSNESK